MAYNEALNDRIREIMATIPTIEERFMFGGVCYMVDDKMCVGVIKEDMMCRVGPEQYEACLEKPGCRQMEFSGRPLQGYVFVEPEALRSTQNLHYWIDLCLAFNPLAKRSARKKSKKKE